MTQDLVASPQALFEWERIGFIGVGGDRELGKGSGLDQVLVAPPNAYIAPYGHRKLSLFLSDRIDFETAEFHPVYFNDYSSWQLTE